MTIELAPESVDVPAAKLPSPFNLLNSEQFKRRNGKLKWLVDGILVQGQPAVIGGPPKSLKTSLAIDLAISLGTGKEFLGKFDVRKRCRVAVYSGESGKEAIADTAKRVCKSKGIEFDRRTRVFWSTNLPRLSEAADLKSFSDELKAKKIHVVIVDPLYLTLHGGSKVVSPSNVYEIGACLKQFSDACLEAGATPILVHHATKTSEKKAIDEPPQLRDLAFAGIVEFARQWIQVKRRHEYRVGSGLHELSLTVGGSAGHASAWNLDIAEGRQKLDFSGRKWQVSVSAFCFTAREE